MEYNSGSNRASALHEADFKVRFLSMHNQLKVNFLKCKYCAKCPTNKITGKLFVPVVLSLKTKRLLV